MSPVPNPRHDPRGFLRALFDAAVARAQPHHVLADFLPPPPRGRTLVLGAGKASAAMAQALESLWPQQAPLSGLVVTRYGHTPPRPPGVPQRIEIVEAAHPVPDSAGLAAAGRMLELARRVGPEDLVLCLISGGGSALLVHPAPGLTLHDKQAINRALLASGATIAEMNCVRKHLSGIKGGRLAQACRDATVITLAISDVPGDDLGIIASGPTVPDPTRCVDALEILRRYNIAVPAIAEQALRSAAWETVKPADPFWSRHQAHLIATPQQSLAAAAALARAQGMEAHILSDAIEGESRDVGLVHAALARYVKTQQQPWPRPCVLLSGGETTVTLRSQASGVEPGRGGRGTEFCLALAMGLRGESGVWALAGDTDGIDGSEDNAGAWVTPDTLDRARMRGLRAESYQMRNDAYSFFAGLDDLLVTGPTHTNVNDFRAVLIL